MAEEERKLAKPGQKHPTPTPGNGDRVFYETLLKQRPDSHMALEWCVQYGVLDSDAAHKAYKKVLKRKEIAKTSGSGSKSPPPPSKKKKKSKKSKSIVDDVEFDAGLDAGGDEGIGTAVM
mmetsp:Transcript_32510/g.77648  ORF Transcript_32510/g.77648 Transcript_32510/m.77648 type:complete len:120 (+) Transcript_32510:120-479(+)